MDDPKVLDMKVYIGKNDEPIFYGYPDENVLFCTTDQQWVDKPPYLDHFHEREVLPEDVGEMIVNDLISPDDFNFLDEAGMIEPTLKKLYLKISDIKDKIAQLESEVSEQPSQPEEMEDTLQQEIEPAPQNDDENEMPFDDRQEEGKSIEPFKKVMAAIFENPNTPLDQIFEGVEGLCDDQIKLIEKIKTYI